MLGTLSHCVLGAPTTVHRYRKLLVTDYNELKLQLAERDGGGGEVEAGSEEEREDPTVLKLKLVLVPLLYFETVIARLSSPLRRAREDLRVANQRITGMMADYSDVVPRREFERMETAYKVRSGREDPFNEVRSSCVPCTGNGVRYGDNKGGPHGTPHGAQVSVCPTDDMSVCDQYCVLGHFKRYIAVWLQREMTSAPPSLTSGGPQPPDPSGLGVRGTWRTGKREARAAPLTS